MALGKKIGSKWFLALLVLTLAGCGASVPLAQTTPGATAPGPAQPSPTPEQLVPSPAATNSPAASLAPVTPKGSTSTALVPSPTGTPHNNVDGSAFPTSASSSGSKTYTNTNWHVALDYPADWSVRESANIVTYVSSRGAAIQLAPVATGGLSPVDFQNQGDMPNTRCTSQTNTHGIVERVCFDTISFSTSAEFIVQAPDGSLRLLELSTSRRTGDIPVLNAMLTSVRPAP